MVAEGRFFDFRHIPMTMAGFIGGPVTAVIAVIVSTFYRYFSGGRGVIGGGVTNLIIFATFGIILGRYFKDKQNRKKSLFWFLTGTVMAGVLLLNIQLIAPFLNGRVPVIGTVTWLFLISTPFVMTIIFKFYFWAHNFFSKALIFDTIINNSSINLMVFDAHGPLLSSKALTGLRSYPYSENPYLLLDPDQPWPNSPNQSSEIVTDNNRHFVTNFTSFQMPSGEYASVAIVNDITDIKLLQEKLFKSQERYRALFENSPEAILLASPDGSILDSNPAGCQMFGWTKQELCTMSQSGVVDINDVRTINAILERDKTGWVHTELTCIHKDRTRFQAETTSKLFIEDDKGQLLNIIIVRDISKRKRAEEILRQSEEKFSKAFHGGPIMMTLSSLEERQYIDVNETFCSNIGYTCEEIIGHTSMELNLVVDMDMWLEFEKKLMEQGKLENVELDFRTKSGEIRNGLSWSQLFYLDGKPCHITGLIDITEQKRTQKEMAKLDRLNLVGQLAAGIAHEIRNPMTTVRGYLQLLGSKPEYSTQKSTFELMISEVDRANAIITEFLSLAQTKTTELKSQNLNDILNNLYPLLEADTFTQNKQIHFISDEIPDLDLNAKEISQLILNLTRNGLEAMQERGSLTIKSYVVDSKVVLEIKDEGCGIPPEYINKLGTPFFTTKDTGTGLGLASCYKIVESHNATVRIDSSSSGTTFFILFSIPDQVPEEIEKSA